MKISFTDILRNLDMFSTEPKTLAFGDPNQKQSRNLYKTSCGGITTIVFVIIVAIYISLQLRMVFGDEGLTWQVTEKEVDPNSLGQVSLSDAYVLPQITIGGHPMTSYGIPDDYKSKVFIGFIEWNDDGGVKRMAEFVPCKDVPNYAQKYEWKEDSYA